MFVKCYYLQNEDYNKTRYKNFTLSYTNTLNINMQYLHILIKKQFLGFNYL